LSAASPRRVALVVIARNEAPRLPRLLDSVRAHVDEMLLLDTGSTDDTVQVARRGGARVAHFAWVDDFAAARNAALDAAAADWHLVLDADEWLVEGADVLQSLRHTAPEFVGTVQMENHFDDGQRRTASDRISRVLPGSVRYAGRVHEQPVHELPRRALALRIAHDGYLPQALARKRGRNRALLGQALREHPLDAYLWYQLGKDAAVYGEYAEAESAFRQVGEPSGAHPPWWYDLVTRRLHALKCLKQHEQAFAWATGQLPACAESPDVHFALGDLMLDWAAECPHLATELLPMIEAAWQHCLQIGERPDLPGAVAGRGSFLAAHNLAVVREGTGQLLRPVAP
jgi:hypothetical protein